MGVSSNPAGPLRYADLMQIGVISGVTFFDRTDPPEIDPQDIDADYTIEMGDRHDLLAYRKLGSSQYGWIIMERNNDIVEEEIDMRLWPNDFVPGYTIKIPVIDSLSRRGIT
jgi:hypothetical protein